MAQKLRLQDGEAKIAELVDLTKKVARGNSSLNQGWFESWTELRDYIRKLEAKVRELEGDEDNSDYSYGT